MVNGDVPEVKSEKPCSLRSSNTGEEPGQRDGIKELITADDVK